MSKDKKVTSKKADKKEDQKAAKGVKTADDKRPKRSWPAFFFFQKETMPDLKLEFPLLSQKEYVSVSNHPYPKIC